MEFILNLITFLLIVIGIIFAIPTSDKNRIMIYERLNTDKLSIDDYVKVENFINKIFIISIFSVALGIGITIARIFS